MIMVESYFCDLLREGKDPDELYEEVQYTSFYIPRLYLMIMVASCCIRMKKTPAKKLIYDTLEMCKGIQHPLRGLFLRNFFIRELKDKFLVDALQVDFAGFKKKVDAFMINGPGEEFALISSYAALRPPKDTLDSLRHPNRDDTDLPPKARLLKKLKYWEEQDNFPFDLVIFDEAHTLEDNAAKHLGLHLTSSAVRFFLNRLYNPNSGRGLMVKPGESSLVMRGLISNGKIPILYQTAKLSFRLKNKNADNFKLYALGMDGERVQELNTRVDGEILRASIDTSKIKIPAVFFELACE